MMWKMCQNLRSSQNILTFLEGRQNELLPGQPINTHKQACPIMTTNNYPKYQNIHKKSKAILFGVPELNTNVHAMQIYVHCTVLILKEILSLNHRKQKAEVL